MIKNKYAETQRTENETLQKIRMSWQRNVNDPTQVQKSTKKN